jgi:hypothetical protein
MNFFVNLRGLVSWWQKETWLNSYQFWLLFEQAARYAAEDGSSGCSGKG